METPSEVFLLSLYSNLKITKGRDNPPQRKLNAIHLAASTPHRRTDASKKKLAF